MNVFKSLDTIFPCGDENRPTGEVVNVRIHVSFGQKNLSDEISMKRKAWYVNASVNAFHMHRSLVRDFTNLVRGLGLSTSHIRRAKRRISLAVLNAYLVNRRDDEQVHVFCLMLEEDDEELPNGKLFTTDSVSMYWDASNKGSDWREIADIPAQSITSIVEMSVESFRLEHFCKEFPLD